LTSRLLSVYCASEVIFMTIKKLRQGIDAYFSRCDEEGVFPDVHGMMLSLNLSRSEYDDILKQGGEAAKELQKARLRRESILTRRQIAAGKGPLFSMQRETDEQDGAAHTVTVIISGPEEYAL